MENPRTGERALEKCGKSAARELTSDNELESCQKRVGQLVKLRVLYRADERAIDRL